jgi:hypothetical protein
MVPQPALLIPIFLSLKNADLLNNLFGLTLTYIAMVLPFTIWTLRGFLHGIPVELEQAAMVDGASRTRIIRTILLRRARTANHGHRRAYSHWHRATASTPSRAASAPISHPTCSARNVSCGPNTSRPRNTWTTWHSPESPRSPNEPGAARRTFPIPEPPEHTPAQTDSARRQLPSAEPGGTVRPRTDRSSLKSRRGQDAG